jgi:hypothetical protein
MVQQSRVEARQAASVVTRACVKERYQSRSLIMALSGYRDTVLDAVHERQSIEALKGEIQQIAQVCARISTASFVLKRTHRPSQITNEMLRDWKGTSMISANRFTQ